MSSNSETDLDIADVDLKSSPAGVLLIKLKIKNIKQVTLLAARCAFSQGVGIGLILGSAAVAVGEANADWHLKRPYICSAMVILGVAMSFISGEKEKKKQAEIDGKINQLINNLSDGALLRADLPRNVCSDTKDELTVN